MKFTEEIKSLISSGEIKEASTDIFEDLIDAILGDRVSIGKIIVYLTNAPFFVREQIFWSKVEMFINGTYLCSDDCAKLCAKLTVNGEKKDAALRLVDVIDRAETQQKVLYIVNATRCLLSDFIDRPTYFRICHAVAHTLEEDLTFLAENIHKTDLPYSANTQGLLTSGMMYQSVIDSNDEQKYSFTSLAEIVDKYAVSYNNIDRYPTPVPLAHNFVSPRPKLPEIPIIAEMSNEEIDNMFK